MLIIFDAHSFGAGQQAGARVAVRGARREAGSLLGERGWWGWRRRRLQARALLAFARDMERAAGMPQDGSPAAPA
jgi:hypothetical protein